MKLLTSFYLVALSLLSLGSVASDDTATALLREHFPHIAIEHVRPSALEGVMEIIYGGDKVAYVSADGRYLFNGALLDLDTQTNLTEVTQLEMRAMLGPRWLGLFERLDDENLLAYTGDAEGPLAGRTITVFTDVTCPWCGRFHNQIDEFNQAGVTINYILFARAGLGSPSHRQHISIWCSDNPHQMLTHAKAGGSVTPASCENPVDEHMRLARVVGVSGTPTLILDTGERFDGFRSAADLIEVLELQEPIEPELP